MSQKYDYCFLKSLDDYVVFDLETTGFSREKDEVIEIAAIRYSHGQKVQEFHSLVRPSKPIPQEVVELTGITQADVESAPTFYRMLPGFYEFIEGLPLVGHNISTFDLPFINARLARPLPNYSIDTLVLARDVFPSLPSYSLVYLNQVLNLCSLCAHRALSDVETTNALFMACLNSENFQSNIADAESGCYDSAIPHKKKSHKSKSYMSPSYEFVYYKSIVPQCENINPNNPLYKKTIVFTGVLSISRAEAMQRAVNAGAILRDSISGKTAYLVVGTQDISVVGDDGMSSKEEKAYALNACGRANIQIINESQFLELLQEQEEGVVL